MTVIHQTPLRAHRRARAGWVAMWPAPRGDPVDLRRVADVAASLQAAVEPSFGPLARASHDDDDDAMRTAKESGADVLESTAESSRGPIAALIARVARQHADKCGDGSRTMLAMVAAGLRRAAEACGDGPPSSSHSHGTVVASERRAKLVDALARLSRGDAGPALLFETLTRVALEVPAPLHGRWATEYTQLCGITRAASPTSRFGWDEDDAFRAAVTAIAGTLMTGAAVSREHRERLALIVTSLVANTLRAASEREHEGGHREGNRGVERLEDHAAFVSRTLSALAANPPVLASADPRGPGVGGSVVVEGTLARVHTWRTRGVTGLDESCKVVVLFRTEPASDDVVEVRGVRMSDGAVVTPAGAREHAEMELDGWRRERILECSRILATRGVKLALCTEQICDETASIFAERGVMTAEGLTERDAVRLCDVLGIHPTTSALPHVLNTCDVGEIEGFSAQKIGGDTYVYLQSPFAYTAIVTGIDVEECEGHKTLVGRALSAVAAASVPCQHPVSESNGEVRVESRGSLTLVPGAGATDACVYSAVKDQLDDFRMWAASEMNAGGVSKTNTSGDGSHPGVEGATAAWEVLLAMARAGPAMLARAVTSHRAPPNPSTKNESSTKNASSFGSLDVVRLWTPVDGPGESTHAGSHSRTHHSHSHSAARRTMDLLAANASAMRLNPVKSVGLLIPGASVEATVPGTRSAMVNHPRVADSIVTAIETGGRRYTDVPTVCDAGEAAVFEPLAGKYAALLGALDLTRQLARIDRVCSVKPGVSLSSLAAVNRLGRAGRDDEESDDTDGDTDASSSYAEDGDDTDLDDLV